MDDRLITRWRNLGPRKWSEHAYGWVMPETGRPIRLTPWQRAVLDAWWRHRKTTSTLAISSVKKVGKTTVNAVLTCWRWLTMPAEHFCAANDMDQAASRAFKMVAQMVKKHPLLRGHCKVTKDRVLFAPTGSELIALSVDAAGNAGANHLTSSHTEAWGIQYESAQRAWEELTPQPGRFWGLPAMRIADSYAGWQGESELWHKLVDRGVQGDRVDRRWPLYKADGLLLFHYSGEEAQERCFRGSAAARERYYADQAADLRPGTFKRLHLNERSSAESAFITAEQWDALIMEGYRCPLPNRDLDLRVGIDIAVKHDHCAAVSVFRKQGALWLGPYRIWRPTPTVDLDAVETWLWMLHRGYGDVKMRLDPYQGEYLKQRLQRRGVRIDDFPQTVGNLTILGNSLFDVIRQAQLIIYPGCEDLRAHVLGAAARETDRGIRLVKGAHSRKIDAAIALGEAVVAAAAKREYGPARCIPY